MPYFGSKYAARRDALRKAPGARRETGRLGVPENALRRCGEPGRDSAGAKFGRWYALAMITPPGRSRLLGHQVLERAVLYEMPPESPGQEATLRRVLQRFIDSASA